MKRIFTLLLIAAATTSQAQKSSDELIKHLTFQNLKNEVKADFGSADNPIQSGAFQNIADRGAMQLQMGKLTNSYRWPDGSALDFSKRGSKQGKTGVVDVYTLSKPGSTDTIRLHVDPYHTSESYYVPKGLVALNAPILEKEISPMVKIAEELYVAPDASALNESSGQLLSAINKQFGTALFIDTAVVAPIVKDKEADKPFGGYLIRSYLFSKFLAMAKNIKNPTAYATKKMKENFNRYIVLHPEVKIGNLKESLK
jgi:hypothetical protein